MTVDAHAAANGATDRPAAIGAERPRVARGEPVRHDAVHTLRQVHVGDLLIKSTAVAVRSNHDEAVRVVRLPVVGGGDRPVRARQLGRASAHVTLSVPAGRKVPWRRAVLANEQRVLVRGGRKGAARAAQFGRRPLDLPGTD